MPLDLHPDCKKRIKGELTKQLPSIEVTNKSFLDRQSTAGFLLASNSLPKHGPVLERMETYIGEWPLYDFLYGYLSKELHEEQKFDASVSVCKLTEMEKYSDSVETANRLVETFDSLPWRYAFSLNFKPFLSPIFGEGHDRYQLSSTISLVKPDERLLNEFPLRSGIEGRDKWLFGGSLLSLFSNEEWDKESVYLQFDTEGFVGKYITTQTNESVTSLLRSFCGLSIALRLTKVEHTYRPAAPKMHFYIHRHIDGRWIIDESDELSEDLSKTISDLVFHDLDGALDTDPRKKSWMLSCLSKLKKVFSNTDQSERLLLAGQWFFDSCTGRNELLSFVQAMVALEILLGDKAASEVVGLNELLRNRCAYLIGKDYAQREKILDEFREIYDVRSKIVHRGKSKLKFRERVLFNKLQWLCRRVIQEEVDLITESENG